MMQVKEGTIMEVEVILEVVNESAGNERKSSGSINMIFSSVWPVKFLLVEARRRREALRSN